MNLVHEQWALSLTYTTTRCYASGTQSVEIVLSMDFLTRRRMLWKGPYHRDYAIQNIVLVPWSSATNDAYSRSPARRYEDGRGLPLLTMAYLRGASRHFIDIRRRRHRCTMQCAVPDHGALRCMRDLGRDTIKGLILTQLAKKYLRSAQQRADPGYPLALAATTARI